MSQSSTKAANRKLLDRLSTPSENKNDELGRTLFLYSKDYKRHQNRPGVFNHLIFSFDSDDYQHEELKADPELGSILKWRHINEYFEIHKMPLYKYKDGAANKGDEKLHVPVTKKDDAEWLYRQINTHNRTNKLPERPSIDLFWNNDSSV